MGRYYYAYHRRTRFQPELLLPVAIVAILLVAVVGAFVSWMLPDEPSITYSNSGLPMQQTQKPSRFEKFVKGVFRAAKDAAKDE
jgi:hypothetical protein